MKKTSSSGVTLIELMILILISAIAVAGATYTLSGSGQNQLAGQLANNLDSALRFARSQAVSRGTTVTICPGTNSSLNTCGIATDWNKGWIVFEDSNADGVIDSPSDILQVFPMIGRNPGITASTTAPFSFFGQFASTGLPLSNRQIDITITPRECLGNNGRRVYLTGAGRIIVQNATCP